MAAHSFVLKVKGSTITTRFTRNRDIKRNSVESHLKFNTQMQKPITQNTLNSPTNEYKIVISLKKKRQSLNELPYSYELNQRPFIQNDEPKPPTENGQFRRRLFTPIVKSKLIWKPLKPISNLLLRNRIKWNVQQSWNYYTFKNGNR